MKLKRKPRNQNMTGLIYKASSPRLEHQQSDMELDPIGHMMEQQTPCLYCRTASEHYAPFRDFTVNERTMNQSVYGGSHILDGGGLPDVSSVPDTEQRTKKKSQLTVAYDPVPPQTGKAEDGEIIPRDTVVLADI